MSDIRFDGRVAVITGAGGGLGKTYALELGRRGAKVIVNDLGGKTDGTGAGHSMADQVVDEIKSAGGDAARTTTRCRRRRAARASSAPPSRSSAGSTSWSTTPASCATRRSSSSHRRSSSLVIDVHLKGAFYVSQPAFRVMKEKGYGRFIFTSSAAGIFGNFGQTNYGAAKMGLVGLMNVLAVEGAKYNIRCNTIAPTARTRMTEELLGPLAPLLDPESGDAAGGLPRVGGVRAHARDLLGAAAAASPASSSA